MTPTDRETVLPRTADRVPEHTAPTVNARIEEKTRARVRELADDEDRLGRRLLRLRGEWDIERVLETNASVLALVGLGLGAFWSAWWLLLPAAVLGFLLWHALQGWCPPVPIFRRLGVRTMKEIDQERYALKALRGDFDEVAAIEDPDARARAALAAAGCEASQR